MAPTPSSSKSNNSTPKQNPSHHQPRTPQSKHRLTFPKETAAAAADHPVEVIGRIRDLPEQKNRPNANPSSALQINGDGKSLRLKTEIGYRDFTLDGVSQSENDDLDGFYKKFVESRINGVKLGQKCTIMMYGPTGSGKSHTMFGCPNQPGIVYNSLRGILGECVGEEDVGKLGFGTFVQVTVLEIYNEEIYDLLPSANNGGGFSLGWAKGGSASKVKLEVMGKKAKNATFISGNEAGKILREIQKVEKRRIVKSTLCNERSSRSHCMIIVDVPTVGGRLMLVDMAGSENIEQAGQIGLEAKLQTAKINQGNIALKRVVESIANGDSHVPFRDSKLTMLLQDSFEDDKSKILMILCASPDPKELHKTIATLEYGAKAKCIVRGPITPSKGADQDSSSAVILGSRIEALDQFICKLQMENKLREKEKNEAEKELRRKEQEVSLLRSKLAVVEASEEEINSKVNERTKMLRTELERKILECQKTANEFVEMEKRKMEERMLQQQKEVEMLRRRLEDMESELRVSRAGSSSLEIDGGNFVRRLMEVSSSDQESDMVKSMDLDKSYDFETTNVFHPCPSRALLTTVYEEEEHENDEVQKEVIEEKKMIVTPQVPIQNLETRQLRIQNIFNLCGNYREVPQHSSTPMPAAIKRVNDNKEDSASITMLDETSRFQKSSISNDLLLTEHLKENRSPLLDGSSSNDIEVYVKWEEASKGNHGKFISRFKVSKDSTLADLRKLIEIHLGGDHPQTFTFLVLGDPSGAPVAKEKEASTPTSKLPICNSQSRVRLACLRSVKSAQWPSREPFSNLENKIVASSHFFTKKGDDECFFSTEIAQQNLCPNNNSTPFL